MIHLHPALHSSVPTPDPQPLSDLPQLNSCRVASACGRIRALPHTPPRRPASSGLPSTRDSRQDAGRSLNLNVRETTNPTGGFLNAIWGVFTLKNGIGNVPEIQSITLCFMRQPCFCLWSCLRGAHFSATDSHRRWCVRFQGLPRQ